MPRVYDLALELGADSRAVLDRLNAHGYRFASPSSLLTPAALAFLRGQPIPPAPDYRSDDFDIDDFDALYLARVTTGDAAILANVAPATIRQWSARGYLTPAGKSGRTTLYARADVERVARQRAWNVDDQRRPVPRVSLQSRDLAAVVSTRDAATLAGVTPATIRTWAARGHLAPVTEPGKRPQLYRVQDVLRAARRR